MWLHFISECDNITFLWLHFISACANITFLWMNFTSVCDKEKLVQMLCNDLLWSTSLHTVPTAFMLVSDNK